MEENCAKIVINTADEQTVLLKKNIFNVKIDYIRPYYIYIIYINLYYYYINIFSEE